MQRAAARLRAAAALPVLLLLLLLVPAGAAQQLPRASAAACPPERVCTWLVTIYNRTQAPARQGDEEAGWTLASRAGWEDAARVGCAAYLAGSGGGSGGGGGSSSSNSSSGGSAAAPPRYCREFYGVQCCSPAGAGAAGASAAGDGAAAGAASAVPADAPDGAVPDPAAAAACAFPSAVSGISLKVNHANASLNDAELAGALLSLERCGLQVLDFEQCRLSGSLDGRVWGRMTRLRALVLTGNWLTGTLPPELGNMRSLELLALDNNYLSGTIPPELSRLRRLWRLNLGAQAFLTVQPNASAEPPAGGGEQQQQQQRLAPSPHLGLTGTIPPGLARLPLLVELNLGLNQLHGQLPSPLCQPGSRLRVFSVRRNLLTGPARGVEQCSQLVHLDLSANRFTGALPASTRWGALSIYLVAANAFEGPLPLALMNAPFISWLDVSHNRLSSGLNDSMALMTYLQSFDASFNRLSGTVPLGLFYLSALHTVDLSHNELSGELPWSSGLAASLTSLVLSFNQQLSGPIPDELGHVGTLTSLQLLSTSMTAPSSSPGSGGAGGGGGRRALMVGGGGGGGRALPRRMPPPGRDAPAAATPGWLRPWRAVARSGGLWAPAAAPEQQQQQQQQWRGPYSDPRFQLLLQAALRGEPPATAVASQRRRLLLLPAGDAAAAAAAAAAGAGGVARAGAAPSSTPAAAVLARAAASEAAGRNATTSIEPPSVDGGAAAAEAGGSGQYPGEAQNHDMPCWLALSEQRAPPPFEASAIDADEAEADVGARAALKRPQTTALTCPLIVRRGEGLQYPWAGGGGAGDDRTTYAWLCPFAQPAHSAPSVDWLLDPLYYNYAGCSCSQGHRVQSVRDPGLGLSRMVCVPKGAMPPWLVGVVAALAPLLCVSLVLLALILWGHMRQRVHSKSPYLRRLELNKRRAKGAPRPGQPASVVVTDIESFSALMSASPPLMTAALGIHNAVMRRAAWANAGVVVMQEGDSFTVAFHRPADAVAFCLQVQVALQRTDWRAMDTTSAGSGGGGGAVELQLLQPTAATKARRRQQQQQQQQAVDGGLGAAAPANGAGGWPALGRPQAAAVSAPQRPESPGQAALEQRRSCPAPSPEQRQVPAAAGRRARSSSRHAPPGIAGLGGGFGARSASASSADGGPGGGRHGRRLSPHPLCLASPFAAVALQPVTYPGGADPGSPRGRPASSDNSSRFWALLLPPLAALQMGQPRHGGADCSSSAGVFNGLRVRMGVATGRLSQDCADAGSSAVAARAQQVSDMGAGGQVLLDAATFAGVRGAAAELGCVDEGGVNLALLDSASWKELLCPWTSGPARDTPEAVFLDMGSYVPRGGGDGGLTQHTSSLTSKGQPSVGAPPAGAAGGWRGLSRNSASSTTSASSAAAADAAGPRQRLAALARRAVANVLSRTTDSGTAPAPPAAAAAAEAAASAAASAAGKPLQGAALPQALAHQAQQQQQQQQQHELRIYQVVHPDLVARAHAFGGDLALVDDQFDCVDSPYFAAPSSVFADLTAAAGAPRRAAAAAPALAALAPAAPHRRLAPLPAMCMVFARVDGGRQHLRGRAEAARTGGAVVAVLTAALRAVPGGYLCRVQGGDFKYMVAWWDPQDALEFCLVVQELLLWQPWSPAVLRLPGFGEVFDEPTGQLLFRGPRLKMGLCEGAPRQVLPDHLGRADYHGAAINLAARYMEVAAHGGQVVCDHALAAAACRVWRGEQAPPLHEVLASSSAAAAAMAADAAGSLPYPCCFQSSGLQPRPLRGPLQRPRSRGTGEAASGAAGPAGASADPQAAALPEEGCDHQAEPELSFSAVSSSAGLGGSSACGSLGQLPATEEEADGSPRASGGSGSSGASQAGGGCLGPGGAMLVDAATLLQAAAAPATPFDASMAKAALADGAVQRALARHLQQSQAPAAAPRHHRLGGHLRSRLFGGSGGGSMIRPFRSKSSTSTSSVAQGGVPLGSYSGGAGSTAVAAATPGGSPSSSVTARAESARPGADAAATAVAPSEDSAGSTGVPPGGSPCSSAFAPALGPRCAAPGGQPAVAPLTLRLPTVAVRRCMLQAVGSSGPLATAGGPPPVATRPVSGRVEATVEVHDLGVFKFKGAPDPVPMVAVATSRLAVRHFPEAPPAAGKGSRVTAPASGGFGTLLDSALVQLPDLPPEAMAFKAAWLQARRQQQLAGPASRRSADSSRGGPLAAKPPAAGWSAAFGSFGRQDGGVTVGAVSRRSSSAQAGEAPPLAGQGSVAAPSAQAVQGSAAAAARL